MIEAKLHEVPETGRTLRVSNSTVWRLVKDGRIRAVRIGKRVLIPESEINRLMQNGTDSKRSAA